MWYEYSVFYQIYPFGFCGAPDQNDGREENRIAKVTDWIGHLEQIGIGAVYFCPVFESDEHGYDTRDYRKIDCRLGSNEAFQAVCGKLHEAGIRVVLDGVFNHVGRGFWAFQDALEKKWDSQYKDWFFINFDGNSNYDDGFWYEGWEGHFNLVKLNLQNPQVREHLFSCIRDWVKEFDIDGLRLDVAYMLDEDFLRELHQVCRSLKPDFFLLGEIIHGDYNRIVNQEMLDSCTNYECFKGMFSSFNALNMFEIAYSVNRQFGPEDWTLYKGMNLFNFVDNHDVSRIASNLKESRHLKAVFAMMFGIPGIPCIYYGSEWGIEGQKTEGNDASLRPHIAEPVQNDITEWITALSKARRENLALQKGGYRQLYLTNQQYVFARECEGEQILVAINAEGNDHTAHIPVSGEWVDVLTNTVVSCEGSLLLPAYSAGFYKEMGK